MGYQVSLLDVPEHVAIKVVYLSGEIDESNLDQFKAELAPMIDRMEVKTFIFHLRDLQFINSMCIGHFAGVYSHLRKQERKMLLAELNEHMLDILTLVGFTNLVETYETLQEAIGAAS